MFARFSDLDRVFSSSFPHFDDLFKAFDRALFDVGTGFDVFDVPAYPRLSVREADEHYLLSVDLPGVEREDLTVSVEEDVLTVRAERRLQLRPGYKATRRERANIRFQRSFRLPKNVNATQVDAELKHGVLTLTLAKVKPPEPRRIAVRSSASELVATSEQVRSAPQKQVEDEPTHADERR